MYSTNQRMIDRFGEYSLIDLTDRSVPSLNVVNEALIAAALVEASSLIDGYLAARYVLPLSTVPDMITMLAENIAFYRLHQGEPSPKVTNDYKEAMATLRDVAKGAVKLPADTNSPAPVSTSGAKVVSGEAPYTNDDYKGYI